MKKILSILFLFIGLSTIQSQTAANLTNLQTPNLDETSGLLFYNNNIITFNDSGGDANLYEINSTTGNILRTVSITNATNVDWEDITQDASFIYIDDIGNNNGNRTDLKVYKISKTDYDGPDNTALAEIISYSYANQTDFTSNPNNNNWDAEGLISRGDNLLIFSKNWANKMVNVYSIPKTIGTHSAVLESSYNTNGLITGAETSFSEDIIYLTGYSNSQAPFMYTIHDIPSNSLDVFSGTVSEKITTIISLGNQVEAIALFEITPTKHRLYISNEKYTFSSGPISITFPAKLWFVEINSDTLLDVPNITIDNSVILYPNPFDTNLKTNKIVDEIAVYDLSGKMLAKQQNVAEIALENLKQGHYFVQIKIDNTLIVKQVIKK
ncbi:MULTISPECIES: T9SS type A sorting domain-containing protein [unclassified Flavobacterium]|uniref:T9SS type A sorting domain-containing protein n=1 Tax=unclassified Flavobacterium TaxID=196869 RepID=UPI001292B75D|nr:MULTISPECIES: T9SS type A sorting domain-containing protein [unclassified Flavobacterium]MQP53084.1 T9SS type A sorting domain-containing protein [Flavobacterium sp. LMO9]MQP62725.1 T9SS type A sorting domain-containing protein [Flavobacterium sp. LMO6]